MKTMANSCAECPYLKNCIKKWARLINQGRIFGVKPEEALAYLTFHDIDVSMTPSVEWMLEQVENARVLAMKEYVL